MIPPPSGTPLPKHSRHKALRNKSIPEAWSPPHRDPVLDRAATQPTTTIIFIPELPCPPITAGKEQHDRTTTSRTHRHHAGIDSNHEQGRFSDERAGGFGSRTIGARHHEEKLGLRRETEQETSAARERQPWLAFVLSLGRCALPFVAYLSVTYCFLPSCCYQFGMNSVTRWREPGRNLRPQFASCSRPLPNCSSPAPLPLWPIGALHRARPSGSSTEPRLQRIQEGGWIDGWTPWTEFLYLSISTICACVSRCFASISPVVSNCELSRIQAFFRALLPNNSSR